MSEHTITDEQYEQVQQQITMMASLMADMEADLAGFLNRISNSEAIVPILNPTLYMRGGKRLSAIKKLAAASLTYATACREFRDAFMEIVENESQIPEAVRKMMEA